MCSEQTVGSLLVSIANTYSVSQPVCREISAAAAAAAAVKYNVSHRC